MRLRRSSATLATATLANYLFPTKWRKTTYFFFCEILNLRCVSISRLQVSGGKQPSMRPLASGSV